MFKIFKRLTTKELIMIVLAVIFVCLNVYLNLKIPDYMSDITTLLSTKGTKASDIFAWNTDAPRDANAFNVLCGLYGLSSGWFPSCQNSSKFYNPSS